MTEVIEDDDNGSPVVSERVQVLAQGIYDEFQTMMDTFGAESIGNLMPLVVNVLENLDSALADNQDHLTALEESNTENEQLSQQYQREKGRRKEIEEKLMRLEDISEQETRELKEKVSTLNMDNQNLNSRVKNQKEQIERLEEKNETVSKEKKELHDRNIELIKGFQSKMETLTENAAAKIVEARTMADSPSTPRAPGFHDFTSPPKGASKKKRQLPIAPRNRRPRAGTGDSEEEFFLGTTPALRPDSPEYRDLEGKDQFPANMISLHAEQQDKTEPDEEPERETSPEDIFAHQMEEDFVPNEDSLLAELHLATSGTNVPGVDQIILENERLNIEKNDLSREADELLAQLRETESKKQAAESSVATLDLEKTSLQSKVSQLEGEMKQLRKDLEEEREKVMVPGTGGDGLTRLEVARVLRERNEYKEKYLSLLEQIRMSDELSLFKKKPSKSKWLDYFAALFSPAKRRQMEQTLADGSPRRPILSHGSPGTDENDDGLYPRSVGYRNTDIIPVLRRTGKRQDELYLTSVSWVMPALDSQQPPEGEQIVVQPNTPTINTCRPMSYQEEGARILCTTSVNPATFISDQGGAVSIVKDPNGVDKADVSMSMVWIVTGVPSLTKVSVIDASAVGEVLETFPVCASPIQCIAAVPAFDDNDPDVLAGLSTARKKSTSEEVKTTLSDRPSSKENTIWMGSDTGVLYVHSAVAQWKKCIHADKLPAPIQVMVYLKGKMFVLLNNANLVVFRRFQDGDWDWDNYSIVMLTQRKDLPCSAMAAVKFNVWCAVGNAIHVVHSHLFKMEATFPVHQNKKAEVNNMLAIGEGVWISFKYDSTLRLFHATSFTHMQDIDIAPSVHRVLVFGSEKRSSHMPIQISTMIPAHNALWIGTENGVLLAFPFTAPTLVAEETGWEFIKEAEVHGQVVPEPFDVRTEHAVEAGDFADPLAPATSQAAQHESPLPKQSSPSKSPEVEHKPFNPFLSVDQVQISIHCHINSVKSLLCVPGLVPKDLAMYEPLGGVYVGSEDITQNKPALFVVSCGEGHLDLRTADKVLQTLHAKETGQSGLPSPATIISEKNYIMVWEVSTP